MDVSERRTPDTLPATVSSTEPASPSRSREALVDAGIAISRPIAIDRALHEAANQIRRAIPSDAIAIAVTDDETGSLHVAHTTGYDVTTAALEDRLAPLWRAAIDAGENSTSHSGAIELTAAMSMPDRVIGAITVRLYEMGSSRHLDDAQRNLATIATQTAAAIDRTRRVRQAEHKSRLDAIAEVATSVAHELRNPLFGISSAAQLLRFRAQQDPVVEMNVGRILREVERLNRMATSLLELGRSHSLHLKPANPDAVWDNVLTAQRGRLESRSIQLRRTGTTPSARCNVDSEALAHAFTNILVNAIDAAPEASDVALTTEVLPGGAWRMRLNNGGAPLSPDDRQRAFEIFFSTKPGGNGIGLAICQRIVEEHGGTIALASSAATGTTVTIVLPPAD
jgi:signal transduction histidine kinase